MFISKEWLESYVEINEQVNVLAERITPVSYTHLTLPTKA